MLKADAHGTLEVVKSELSKRAGDKVNLRIVRADVGDVVSNDVFVADTAQATVVGYGVDVHRLAAKKLSESRNVDLINHDTLGKVVGAVTQLMESVLPPLEVEKKIGEAEVRKVIKSSRYGPIAGCFVTEGVVRRNSQIRITRDGIVLWQGPMKSLRRFKDEANEVRENFECGILLKGFSGVKAGDQFESIAVKKVKQKLTQEKEDERSSDRRNQKRRRRETR